MNERDAIYRAKLIELMTTLNGDGGKSPEVRRVVGSYAYRMVREAGAVSWQDLKARVNAATYDSMLRIFAEQSATYAKQDNADGVLALEALGLSLVGRFQTGQPDLLPGIGFLDRYVERCAAAVGRAAASQAASRATPH